MRILTAAEHRAEARRWQDKADNSRTEAEERRCEKRAAECFRRAEEAANQAIPKGGAS